MHLQERLNAAKKEIVSHTKEIETAKSMDGSHQIGELLRASKNELFNIVDRLNNDSPNKRVLFALECVSGCNIEMLAVTLEQAHDAVTVSGQYGRYTYELRHLL